MILLDTNVVSGLRATRRPPDPGFSLWLTELKGSAAFLSAITVLELERGTLQLERRDPAQGSALRRWLELDILPRFAGRILAVDDVVASRCAQLHVPDPRPDLDALIAATALVHNLTLATRNVRDFHGTGVRLIDPWTYRVGTGSGPE